MKIYISADMEGVCGITNIKQVLGDSREYEEARKLMTNEVNAAIEGALDGGAVDITINDSHGYMRNIVFDDLNPQAKLISGFPKQMIMMEGINETYDGAVFIGYHAMAGTKGVLAHTISRNIFSSIEINGVKMGEFGLNAALAGHFNVPILMVSGDDVLQEEVVKLVPEAEYAQVKKAVSTSAAEYISPIKAQSIIREKMRLALKNLNKYKAFKPSYPVNLEIILANPLITDIVQAIPGVKRVSANTIAYVAKDFIETMKVIFIIITTGSYAL